MSDGPVTCHRSGCSTCLRPPGLSPNRELCFPSTTGSPMERTEVSKLSKAQAYRLFELAQSLLALGPDLAAAPAFDSSEPGSFAAHPLVHPFLGVFGIDAVWLYDGSSAQFLSTEPVGPLEGMVRATYIAGPDQVDADANIVIRRLLSQGKIIGAIAFRGLEEHRITAEPLAQLAAALIERSVRAREAASAVIAAEISAFRAAVLDTLGTECKNSLTTILAATGGLREAGPIGWNVAF